MARTAGANPGTRIVAKIVFPVDDMAEAVGFYQRLGFDVETYDDGYAWVRNGDDEVAHLALVEDLDVAANRAAGYWHVQDVDDWHAAWTRSGAAAAGEVVDRPWGMREFEITDPAGNLLRVGQNL